MEFVLIFRNNNLVISYITVQNYENMRFLWVILGAFAISTLFLTLNYEYFFENSTEKTSINLPFIQNEGQLDGDVMFYSNTLFI